MTFRAPTLQCAVPGIAAVLLAAGLLVSCAPRSEPPPNVLLITLDTLRRDHLSAYGYPRPTSPFLDSLAARGTRFTAAYATSNVTKPSHASILTALYPKHHGIVSNNEEVLHQDIRTLAEVFKDRGFGTFAVVATHLLSRGRSGLDQGFDAYYDNPEAGQRLAGQVTTLALRQLDDWRQQAPHHPFFGWLHFYDPHIPYTPPAADLQRFWTPPSPGEERLRLPVYSHSGTDLMRNAIPREAVLGPVRDPEYYTAAYDGEIAYLDGELRRLFETLEDWGLLENTIVAVTADHGELLGEHGLYYSHASIYESVAAVPLIFLVPGRTLPCGQTQPPTVDTVVSNLDIAPTILELLGWPPLEQADGQSLVPLLEGRERGGELEGYAFTQHSYDLLVSARSADGALIMLVPSPAKTVATPFHRFDREAFLDFVGARPFAFYPRIPSVEQGRETASLDPDDPRARRLLDALRRWRSQKHSFPAPERRRLSGEEIEQLRTLGYL